MKGFSLLETIIAIAILAVGISGSVALISRTVAGGASVRNQLIASNLAQEGMEVVHNIRTTNWVEDAAWDDGLIEGDSCMNFDSQSLINPCDGAARHLFVVAGRYSHDTAGGETIFRRHVTITTGDDNGTPFKLVQSTVSWDDSSLSAEERLYDWK